MGEHAVVLGASVGGLLAARVLRDHFRRVTVLERDALPALGEPRKGVPQGQHAHALLARGTELLEGLFPGFTSDMKSLGALVANVMRDATFVLEGHRLPMQQDDSMTSVLSTRALLEGYLRQRMLEEAIVRIRPRCEATGLIGELGAVRGVRYRELDRDRRDGFLEADLVVDATGRGSRLPSWLEMLGHPRPALERIAVDLGYASAVYQRAPGKMNDRLAVLVSSAPPQRRAGVALALDRDRFVVTLTGFLGEHPRPDHASMREFARGLPAPDLAALLDGARPVSDPVQFKYPYSQRLRYEHVRSHPTGVLAFADALCSFNPVYGQGMTVAALQAELLGRLLKRVDPGELPRVFHRKAAHIVDDAWQMSAGADLRFPDVEGPRSLTDGLRHAYFARVLAAASKHRPSARQLVRVLQLADPPSALLAPGLLARALMQTSPRGERALCDELAISGVR